MKTYLVNFNYKNQTHSIKIYLNYEEALYMFKNKYNVEMDLGSGYRKRITNENQFEKDQYYWSKI